MNKILITLTFLVLSVSTNADILDYDLWTLDSKYVESIQQEKVDG